MPTIVLCAAVAVLAGCTGESPGLKMPPVEGLIAKAVDVSKLQMRGNLGYLPNTDKPYTGWIKDFHEDSEQVAICGLSTETHRLVDVLEVLDNEEPSEELLFNFKKFLYGIVVSWYENGQKQGEVILKDCKPNGQKEGGSHLQERRKDFRKVLGRGREPHQGDPLTRREVDSLGRLQVGQVYGKEKEMLKFLPIMYADGRKGLRSSTGWALISRPVYPSPIPPNWLHKLALYFR